MYSIWRMYYVQYMEDVLCTVYGGCAMYSIWRMCYVQYMEDVLCTVYGGCAMYSIWRMCYVQYMEDVLKACSVPSTGHRLDSLLILTQAK